MIGILERAILRFTAWSDARLGVFELPEPLVIRDGSAWLRLGPNDPPMWFITEQLARDYRSSRYYSRR